MYMQDYNNENTKDLGNEIIPLGLPEYKGIHKNSRMEGLPTQLIVRCDDLTPEQETALIAVIDAHVNNEVQIKADELQLRERQAALAAVWSDPFDLLDDILNELKAQGITLPSKTLRDTIKADNPKP